MYKLRAWPCVWIAAFVAGCTGGSGEGLDASGRPIGEVLGGGPLVATFGSIQANVFTQSCALSGCHTGAAAPQGLRLDAANSYALLVGVPSNEVPALDRVEPGDPDSSYLVQKLEGRAAVGERMPRGGPYLSQATIDVIRQWITDGAQPDPGNPDAAPTVVSVTPADGATLDAFPAEVTVIFSQDMDASLVGEASVLLSASGGDGGFADGNETVIVPASVTLDAANPRRAVMDLTSIAGDLDVYELRLTAADPVAIADVNGNVLDGDGDGEAGGDFVSTFVVADVLPTLQSIQEKVFTPICSVCHTGPPGPTLPSGQDLTSAEASFASLVDVASNEVPSLPRIDPGNADGSYLVQKIEGTAAVGDQMPQGGPPLSAATIAAIRAWIDAGAPFDGGADDVTPPTVNLDALPAGVSGTVTLNAQADDDVGVERVEFYVNDTAVGTDTSAPYSVAWDTTTFANGVYAITADAFDAAGNVGRTRATIVEVSNDVTAPTVSLTQPAEGAAVAGLVSLVADAADDVGVTTVDFLVDGALIGTDAAAPYEIDWDSTTVADGAHALSASARDAAGNAATSAAVNVSVVNDATPPTATITAPAAGATVNGSVAVTVSADDDVGVARVDVLVDALVIGSDTTAPFQVLWDTAAAGDGAHTLIARAVDAVGNAGESASVNVTVDNSCVGDVNPPSVALAAPAAGLVSGSVTVSADANDDVGVTQVLFFAGAALIGSDASAPYGIDWDTTTEPDGPVNLTARARDACGNETTSVAVIVNVDNNPLSVTSIDPANGATLAALPAAIDVSFDEQVDVATVGAGSFQLVRSGGDGVFDNGNDIAIVAPVAASGAGASMDLSGVANVEDSYRVTLYDSITDLAGNALDGDGDTTLGGDFVASFSVDLVTYTDDTQPIYFDKCDPCHTGLSFGNHDIGINYLDALKPSEIYPQCFEAGLLVGQCTIVLIQEGEMPFGAGCTGDPAQDAGNPDCLSQAEQDTIQAWIDAGMPE